MKENNCFYTLAESPKEIVSCKDARYFIHKRDWGWVKGTKAGKLKVFFIDIDDNEAHIEEVPPEFLALDDSWAKYETSVNFTIHGQFFTSELAWRAHKRMFTWDMYVWRLPVSEWLPARDVPQTREILENYFPLKTGDTGPTGGIIIKCDNTPREPGYHCVEAAPVDAGWAAWQDAQRLCGEFSHNGIDGWRLPTSEELNIFAHTARARLRAQNVLQTTGTVLNWSSARSGETAIAVVTQENEDNYLYPYTYTLGGSSGGYYKSSNGPYRGHEKELPVTHCYPVRLVRDFYAKRIVKE